MKTLESRPEPFPPGMHIGMHLTIERLQSTGPRRTYYIANNRKPRWYTHICWGCGNKHNPVGAPSCEYCQQPITKRRFLLSARWNEPHADAFHAFAAERVDHYAVNAPIVLYRYRGQLLAFYEIGDEALLVDEPAPLRPRTVLAGAWTLAAALEELLKRGFVLDGLGPEHILVGRNGSRLWDPDVLEKRKRPVHRLDRATSTTVQMLGELLLPYIAVDQTETADFMQRAAEGAFKDLPKFQGELRALARSLPPRTSSRSVAALSSVGRKRTLNEDSWGWRRVAQFDVFAVADGMGGFAAGDVASRTAIQAALAACSTRLPNASDMESTLVGVVSDANRAVQSLSNDQTGPTGTTLVVLVLQGQNKGWMAHIGDSRAYRIRNGRLTPLTEDHSMVQAMVLAGKISREEARVHPRSNVLLQYLGNDSEPEPDVSELQLKAGDRVLMCSDGLWGEMSEADLEILLSHETDERRQLRVLNSAANESGGKDNITGLVVSL